MGDPAFAVLGRDGRVIDAALTDDTGGAVERVRLDDDTLPGWVRDRESAGRIRWVWNDTARWYPRLLRAGVTVARCWDLRLGHAILRWAQSVPADDPVRTAGPWASASADPAAEPDSPALFEWDGGAGAHTGLPSGLDAALAEWRSQEAAVRRSEDPARLRLLLAAESAGGLLASELTAAGVPWDVAEHERVLTTALGEIGPGGRPRRLEELAAGIRTALGDPALNPDSPPQLLRSLRRAGITVQTTGRWELAQHEHPAIAPLLEYKKLARLLTANGWAWLDEWVRDGRFRPVYVPGGVVTGRWASSGGGALQIPRQLRQAVRADPGWKLVVADVAQLEPRVLAGMSSDASLAQAARGRDLYAGIVEATAIATRPEAKVAMLGAMYGATTGDSGRLVPHLRRSFPRAMRLVDDAARIGEDGGAVSTWLGRTSPPPDERWRGVQRRASEAGATAADIDRARRAARDRGRFTRNFVVQGTAAEWALAWLADLRGRLSALPAASASAPGSGPVFSTRAHAAFFLHDEVIVHTPAELADDVAAAVQASAAEAARLLFGDFPLDFPLDVRIADAADKA
ncbi:bifunctional 3'-5' exonuclease/DNA polymerase [Microbacterium thalassium]|uniref:DNA-directed DNA polymerase n=1 Tax=Microbacterium thalassium TaxID=362649 RepID=A0A7X0FQR3_9MICO|nr:bifunctional 3'-5' exonuclease/DNA polymerase [Microbacterium thalassium]MBB6391962.1 DNA polymerase-1 [Microbacterium thalassium]GLK23982.1 bifunctional 3'-5' exonuclease/DNA polymerase [Microbacterium thalassium]